MTAHQISDIRKVLEHGDEIIELVATELDAEQVVLQLATLVDGIERDGIGWLYPTLLLDREFAEEEGYQEAIAEDGTLTEEEKARFRELQERSEPHRERLWEPVQVVFSVGASGRRRWGQRSVQRRLDLLTGIPMLRMILSSADETAEELFDTEESTHAFIRNATGLLWSVAETYKECNAHDHDLPQYLRAKDEWAVKKLLEVLRSLCQALDIDFDAVVEESGSETEE